MFENMELKRIFVPKREEGRGGGGRMRNEKLRKLHFSSIYY
jgi:hypothetical protein